MHFSKILFNILFNCIGIFVLNLFMSRNLIMYGSFEILSFYIVILVNMNLRGFFIFMLMYNAA